jgi:hypothetical protein
MAKQHLLDLLGTQADSLLNHNCTTIDKKTIHLPGKDFVDRIFKDSDRSIQVLKKFTIYLWQWKIGQYRLCEHITSRSRN